MDRARDLRSRSVGEATNVKVPGPSTGFEVAPGKLADSGTLLLQHDINRSHIGYPGSCQSAQTPTIRRKDGSEACTAVFCQSPTTNICWYVPGRKD